MPTERERCHKFCRQDRSSWMEALKKIKSSKVPQISAATTAWTGAELTFWATVSDTKARAKVLGIAPNIHSTLAIVDPLFIRLQPRVIEGLPHHAPTLSLTHKAKSPILSPQKSEFYHLLSPKSRISGGIIPPVHITQKKDSADPVRTTEVHFGGDGSVPEIRKTFVPSAIPRPTVASMHTSETEWWSRWRGQRKTRTARERFVRRAHRTGSISTTRTVFGPPF